MLVSQTLLSLHIPLAIVLSFLVCLLLVLAVIRLCHRLNIYDHPGKHKRHKKPIPNLGGSAIFLTVWIVLGLFMHGLDVLLPEVKTVIPYIFLGSLIIYLIGLLDDFKPLSAWVKLMAQVAAGLVLYYGGLSINLINLPLVGIVEMNGFAWVITVLWVVALSNAINLIDGLDGLAAGVSIIAAATMIIVGLLYNIDFVILLSGTLVGALAAFWIYNRYPARIFLGDNGSLLLGYFFAVLSLVVPIKSYTSIALFIPLLILGVPLIETASSFIRRLLAGKNIMSPDRRHIFHYLAYAGLSHRQIVYMFIISSLVFSLISIAMFLFSQVTFLTILCLFIVVILILYFILISRLRDKQTAK